VLKPAQLKKKKFRSLFSLFLLVLLAKLADHVAHTLNIKIIEQLVDEGVIQLNFIPQTQLNLLL